MNQYRSRPSPVLLMTAFMSLSACGGDSATPPAENTTQLDTEEISCFAPVDTGMTRTLSNRNDTVDYLVTCEYPIRGELIIDPDVTIEFRSGAGFKVDGGSIQAIGTAEKPISFTGEDKIAGAWKGIFVDSDNVKNELSYVNIDHAGGGYFNSNGDMGAVVIYSDTKLKIENATISNSQAYGINASYGGSTLVLKDNTISGCEAPMFLRPQYPSTIVGGTYTGNVLDAIVVESYTSVIADDATWEDHGVPYRITDRLDVVAGGGKLTIQPGVTMEFGDNARLYINEGASGSKPSLVAVGTAESPIIFTSINKVKGAWRGIYFDTPSVLNEIAFATIEYASNPQQKGAIFAWYGTVLNVHHVDFNFIQNDAIHVKTFDPVSHSVTSSSNTFRNVDGADFSTSN